MALLALPLSLHIITFIDKASDGISNEDIFYFVAFLLSYLVVVPAATQLLHNPVRFRDPEINASFGRSPRTHAGDQNPPTIQTPPVSQQRLLIAPYPFVQRDNFYSERLPHSNNHQHRQSPSSAQPQVVHPKMQGGEVISFSSPRNIIGLEAGNWSGLGQIVLDISELCNGGM